MLAAEANADDRDAAGPVIPSNPAERVPGLDAVRGLALFGVLAINLIFGFRVSMFQQYLPGPSEVGLDPWIDAVLLIVVDAKAFVLFSLLFGVGLAIQFERLARTPHRTALLVRRLLVLLGFGLAHLYLIWNGDILTEYAVAGLIVLPLLFGPTWLAATLCAACLALYVLQWFLPPIVALPDQDWLNRQVEAANRVYATGNFTEILDFRIREAAVILPLHLLVLPRTLGLFLLGALAWRSGLVRHAARFTARLWWFAAVAVAMGVVLTLATSARAYSGGPSLGPFEFVASSAGAIVMALGYAAALLAAGTTRTGRRRLAWAEPVGRMAFTNYIAQSVVLGFVFYGYGLGLFGTLGLAAGFGIVLALYAAQVVASRLWLDRFRYGPLEWAWRSLTYGHRLPMRRA